MTEQLNPSAQVNPELAQTPELVLTQLIDHVEDALAQKGTVPPRLERGWGWCNTIPDVVTYCAKHEGHAAGTYQVNDLHLAAANIPPSPRLNEDELNKDEQSAFAMYRAAADAWREGLSETQTDISDAAFLHGFNIVSIQGELFIVDLTFSQFMGEDGFIKAGPPENKRRSGIATDNPLAQQMYLEGYAPLTGETLREYLRLTTDTPDPVYLDGVSTELLSRVEPYADNPDDDLEERNLVPIYPRATL